jgi:hypothetical protein
LSSLFSKRTPPAKKTMKQLFTIYIFIVLIACSSKRSDNATNTNPADSLLQNTAAVDTGKITSSHDYDTSTFDNARLASTIEQERESLKQLADKKVFSTVHKNLILSVSEVHREYFNSKFDYELLAFAKGDLFQNNGDDYAFVVYDNKNVRISFLVYNEQTNKYSELYRDIKIENGLQSADCNYGAFGTLDYQLAGEIIYQQEYLLEKPESYLESAPCKITDLSKDETFALESGCFSKQISNTHLSNSLCISTSAVYNNWECLKYDKSTNTFVIYYGQAFAD